MKQLFFSLLVSGLLTTTVTNHLQAQFIAKDGLHQKFDLSQFKDEPDPLMANSSVTVNTKILKSFGKNFTSATNVSWYQVDNLYVAKFNENEVANKIYYAANGNVRAAMRCYSEKLLPSEVRRQVKSTYYDFTILQVIEVTVGDATAYLVQMQDEKSYLTVRIQDGEMNIYSAFKKAE